MLGGIVMIEEQFVSFDTAKLLKEAGFDLSCRGVYVTDRTGYYEFREYDNKQTTDDLCWNTEDGFQYEYLAPTQALAAKWLRDVHRIDIVIDVIDEKDYCCDIFQNKQRKSIAESVKQSFEEVLEDGLKYALGLIKKQ